jgi:UDP-N-acetylglucosamine diphosphorylase/glucosamine-1-phosphate N-acetyltransferase
MTVSPEAKKINAIILAAGKGTRMKSELAKVLHPLCGRPMLAYPVDTARAVGAQKIVIVIGHQADMIREAFAGEGLIFVEQKEQLGTAHAIRQTRHELHDYEGTVIILCGDVPLLLPPTVQALFDLHVSEKATVTVLTTILDDPYGYGRVVKGRGGEPLRIVEEKDATAEEKTIREINTGIYCVESRFLFWAVEKIGNNNAQGEYYLTDIIGIARSKGVRARTYLAADPMETMGINTPGDLERACLQKRISS